MPAAGTLASGFFDDTYVQSGSDVWFQRTIDAGGDSVRIPVTWRSVAPAQRPAGFVATDPNSPGYDWSGIDRAVAGAAAHNLSILLTVDHAPDWAEGAHPRPGVADGAWRPDPAAFAAFLTAAAKRYGSQVGAWQLWNEPNLDTYLAPQEVVRKGYRVITGPTIYRGLLDAGAQAIRAVEPKAVIVTGGTAPFGDYPVVHRTPPVTFVRLLLCLDGHRHRASCPHRSDFDVLAHHPYTVGSPTAGALNAQDVSVPDLGRLTRLVDAAVRQHTVVPAGRKRLWITEFSYDSKPPDPQGIPEALRARWIGGALHEFAKQGVDRVYWYRIVDEPPDPSYNQTYQSGAYFLSGAAKPSLRAFVLPFDAYSAGSRGAGYWGRAPSDGVVALQVRGPAGWRTVRSIHARAFVPFSGTVKASGRTSLRLVFGGQSSASFTLRLRQP